MRSILREENKGFTFVELLIAVAIAVAAAAAIFSFMVVGSRAFASNSTEVELQSESQLVANQLQDLLIDTAIGVEYFYDSGSGDISIVSDAEIPTGTTVTSKKLHMYNQNVVYVAEWNVSQNRLIYEEYDVVINTDPITGKQTATCGAQRDLGGVQLMGEKMTQFSVDLSNVESRNVVRVDMTFSQQHRSYQSSHNITLRNRVIVGKEIPDYIDFPEIVKTVDIIGPDEIYMEPGETYDIPANHPITVMGEDGNPIPIQDVYFVPSADISAYALGTGVNTGGVVTTSKSQKDDFYVVVYSADGRVSKSIAVKMILVESITVEFEPAEGALDELESGVLTDDLAAGEEFRLRATLRGKNLAKAADADIYKMDWSVDIGADSVKIISASESVVGEDTNTATAESVCKVNNMLFTQIEQSSPIRVAATSTRSLTNYETPVSGYFTGGVYRKKEAITIEPFDPDASMMRGMHNPYYVIMSNTNTIDTTNYICLYEVKVTEHDYKQDGSVVETTSYVHMDDYTKIEGNGVGIIPPETLNPNAAYTYEYCLYVFVPNAGDANKWGILQDYPQYKKEDCEYVSNVISHTLRTVDVYLEIGSDLNNNMADRMTDILIPRTFNKSRDGGGEQINHTLLTGVSNSIRIEALNYLEFSLYQPRSDGSWYYSEETKYEFPGGKEWLQIPNSNASMTLRYIDTNWTNDVPEHLRLVPSMNYKEADGTPNKAVMFNSYIDIYTKNIKVDNIYSGQFDDYTYCYFPAPMDNDFPGSTGGRTQKWVFAYPTNMKYTDQPLAEKVYNQEILYTLSNQNNVDDTIRWNLELMYLDGAGNEVSLGQYYCDSDERIWTERFY